MYHRINTVADEKLLEQMLQLQSQIRTQREAERRTKTYNSVRYAKMFEPVTKSIEKLLPAAESPEPEPKPEPVEPGPVKEELLEPGELYKMALSQIPRKLRDDGTLGLNVDTHRIGDYVYEVEGDILHVNDKEFEIKDLNLWKLMIVYNPSKIQLRLKDQNDYYPFVYQYADIIDDLGLLDYYNGSKRRVKYEILSKMHKGSGFLFSVQPPTFLPSDRMGILSELHKALAELRAGNTMMRNLVVPLAQEARRMNILPPNLLSPDEETWIFA